MKLLAGTILYVALLGSVMYWAIEHNPKMQHTTVNYVQDTALEQQIKELSGKDVSL